MGLKQGYLRKMITDPLKMNPICVLGLGNVLLTDEGVGVHALELFQRKYRTPEGVDLIDGGTSGVDMIDLIANREFLLVIDAVHTGDEPGSLVSIAGDDVRAFFRTKISPHQLGLSDLLAHLELTDERPKGMEVIGMVPKNMDTGVGLTDELKPVVERAAEIVAERLRDLGHPPERRPEGEEPAALGESEIRWTGY